MTFSKTKLAELAGVSVPLLRYYISKFDREERLPMPLGGGEDKVRVSYARADALALLSTLAAAFREQGKDRKAGTVEAAHGLISDLEVLGTPGEIRGNTVIATRTW